nr:15076_t:CDS:10 [Entrophospora candida]
MTSNPRQPLEFSILEFATYVFGSSMAGGFITGTSNGYLNKRNDKDQCQNEDDGQRLMIIESGRRKILCDNNKIKIFSNSMNLLKKYENFILTNASQISSIESSLKTLTYVLPGRFADAEFASEALFSALSLIGLYHDSILVRALEKLPPYKKPKPSPHNRYTKYWLDSSKTYQYSSFALTLLQNTEVLLEMGIQKKLGKEVKWKYIGTIELMKMVCRIILLYKTHGRAVVYPQIPGREIDPHIFNPEEAKNNNNNYASPSYFPTEKSTNDFNCIESKESESWVGRNTNHRYDSISTVFHNNRYSHTSDINNYLMNKVLLIEDVEKPPELVHKLYGLGIISELLYIIRPLIYVLTLRKYGNKSWKPWLLSIIIEVYTRILTNYFHKKISDGSHRLTSVEKDEEKRRIKQLFLYILRGPFYEKITRPKIDKICQSVGNKPILSLFGGILRDYQPIWENKLLKWSIENTDTSNKSSQQQSPEEKRSQIDPEIIDYILGKSDAVYMKEAIEVISNTEETIENRKIAFDNLEMLISFLSLPEVPLRILAAWVCGTAVQNNPKAQKAFAEHGGIKVILDMLSNLDEDLEVKSKALYAISGAIKHFKSGLEQFDKYNGYDTLLFLLKSSDNLQILRKTVFLFNNLLLQEPTVVANRIEEKGLAKQMIKLLKTFGEKDGDLAEKVLLAEFLYSSKLISQEGIKELKEVLPEIKRKYGEDTLSTEEWIELEKQIDKL